MKERNLPGLTDAEMQRVDDSFDAESYAKRLAEYKRIGSIAFILPTAGICALGGIVAGTMVAEGLPFPTQVFVPLIGMSLGFVTGSIIGEGFAIIFSRIATRFNFLNI